MERSTKIGEKSSMSEAFSFSREDAVREASETLQELFTKGTLQRRVLDAQKVLKTWGPNRVREVFLGKATRIHSHEMDELRARKQARQLEEARQAHGELTALIVGMEEALLRIDPDHYGEAVAGLRHSRGATTAGVGCVDSSRAGGERQ